MKGCASVVWSVGILWDKKRTTGGEGVHEGRREGRGQQRWPQGVGRVGGGREEDDKFALGHPLEVQKPKRHLSAKILADGPAQLTSWGLPLCNVPLTAPLSCHFTSCFSKMG